MAQKRNMPSKTQIFNAWFVRGYQGDKEKCMECGEVFPLQRCHIVARCEGGEDAPHNLVLCCQVCHVLTDGRNKQLWEQKLLGDGISSLRVGGVRIPFDYILRAAEKDGKEPGATKFMALLDEC